MHHAVWPAFHVGHDLKCHREPHEHRRRDHLVGLIRDRHQRVGEPTIVQGSRPAIARARGLMRAQAARFRLSQGCRDQGHGGDGAVPKGKWGARRKR